MKRYISIAKYLLLALISIYIGVLSVKNKNLLKRINKSEAKIEKEIFLKNKCLLEKKLLVEHLRTNTEITGIRNETFTDKYDYNITTINNGLFLKK